jgi:hypothetical protein
VTADCRRPYKERRVVCPDAKECGAMAKRLAGIAIAVVVLGAITQLVIPGFVERNVESQLEEQSDGGDAVVDAKAFPAVRLLFGSGDRFEVRGRGLRVELDERADDPLGRLKRFDEVDIDLEDLTAGPIDVQAFSLIKNEEDTSYYLRIEAETTPVAVAESVGGQLGGEIGRLIAGAGASTLPDGGTTDLPIDMEGQVNRAAGGAVDVDAVTASVAGVPAGPFAEAMVQAVLERL